MDPLTVVLLVVALFVLFLMATSGQRKKRLEQALSGLEKERLNLLKSIEHVRISFYKKKIDEREAQSRIFEFEEKLRGIETKIREINEKPLMRTLRKHEEEAIKTEVGSETKAPEKEAKEVKRAQTTLIHNMGTGAIIGLFVIVVIAIIAVMAITHMNPDGGGHRLPGPKTSQYSLARRPSQRKGLHPATMRQ